jgi:hypothetical protein
MYLSINKKIVCRSRRAPFSATLAVLWPRSTAVSWPFLSVAVLMEHRPTWPMKLAGLSHRDWRILGMLAADIQWISPLDGLSGGQRNRSAGKRKRFLS